MNGLMEGDIKVNGFKIICKEKEFTLGRMEEDTKGNILMIKNMVMDNMYGLMEENI